jgi:tRNA A37 methylthiotransferase MiaB
LIELQDEIWCRETSGLIGQVWDAVVEGPARHPEGAWRLRTANNRKVVLPDGELTVGEVVSVKVAGIKNTTFLGEPA